MTIGTHMVREDKTARQIFEEVMANPARAKFGFGEKLAIVNVDFQNAYTRIDEFKTAYEADPRQIEYANTISRLARAKGMPVIWTLRRLHERCERRWRMGHPHGYARFAPEHQIWQPPSRIR